MIQVEYQVEPDGEWLKGLSVEGDKNSTIINSDGTVVADREKNIRVHDIRFCPSVFCMTLKGDNNNEDYNNW